MLDTARRKATPWPEFIIFLLLGVPAGIVACGGLYFMVANMWQGDHPEVLAPLGGMFFVLGGLFFLTTLRLMIRAGAKR